MIYIPIVDLTFLMHGNRPLRKAFLIRTQDQSPLKFRTKSAYSASTKSSQVEFRASSYYIVCTAKSLYDAAFIGSMYQIWISLESKCSGKSNCKFIYPFTSLTSPFFFFDYYSALPSSISFSFSLTAFRSFSSSFIVK